MARYIDPLYIVRMVGVVRDRIGGGTDMDCLSPPPQEATKVTRISADHCCPTLARLGLCVLGLDHVVRACLGSSTNTGVCSRRRHQAGCKRASIA